MERKYVLLYPSCLPLRENSKIGSRIGDWNCRIGSGEQALLGFAFLVIFFLCAPGSRGWSLND